MLSIGVALLGMTVIAGWHLHSPALIQVHPDLAPMQYNTALCFLLTGAAICLAAVRRFTLAAIPATVAAAIGLLTLAQYLFGSDLGIDELLFEHYIFVKTSHPGRMSPASALTFSFSGIAVSAMCLGSQRLWSLRTAGLLGSLAGTLGLMALVGYTVGLAGTRGWNQLTQMAVHTSVGAIALGMGIVIISWREENSVTGRAPGWLPVGAVLSGLFGTFILWNALGELDTANSKDSVAATAESVRLEISSRLESRKKALERMAERWEAAGGTARDEWEKDADSYYGDFPGYRAIAWVDEETRVRWLVPVGENEEARGRILGGEPRRKAAFDTARDTDSASFSRPVELIGGGLGVLLPEPLYHGGGFDGYIVGVIDLRVLFDAIIPDDLVEGCSLTITEGGVEIYSRNSTPAGSGRILAEKRTFSGYGAEWIIIVRPLPGAMAGVQSSYPEAVMFAGIFLSCLLGISVRLALAARSHAMAISSTNLELQSALAELDDAQNRLVEISRQAGMAEVATSVLHNVGNVLNSVNVSCSVLVEKMGGKRIASLAKACALLSEKKDVSDFLRSDPGGAKIPGFLTRLSSRMEEEREDMLAELALLARNIDHIKEIVAMQQAYATVSGVSETVAVTDLIEDSIRMNGSSYVRHNVTIRREYAEVPPVHVEKHKALQILVNLIGNARHACADHGTENGTVTIRVRPDAGFVITEISDNGIGIPPENLTRVFAHGFTTRKEGHGFGLHSSALAAVELGGSLTATSDGSGEGATFTLRLPVAESTFPS